MATWPIHADKHNSIKVGSIIIIKEHLLVFNIFCTEFNHLVVGTDTGLGM